MTRVATIPMNHVLFEAIGRSQTKLAATQLQMATGKKAADFAGLGVDGARNTSARTLLARQDAHKTVAERLSTTLALQDFHLSSAESAVADLRARLLEATGTDRSAGLQGAMEEAFQQFRAAMNGEEAGVPLFAGAQTGRAPFIPATLGDAAGLPASAAFANDDVRKTARIGETLDLQFGLTASDVGGGLFEAFRTLAETGPISDVPTPAQTAALKTALGQLDGGLKTLRAAWAENGRRQAQVEEVTARAEERGLVLHQLISRNEDADMADVASQLTQQRTLLEASYAAFARLSELSLINFLR